MTFFRATRCPMLALLFVLTATTARGASVGLSVGSADAKSGEAIAVPVTVKSAAKLGSLQTDLVYDPAVLEIGKVETGALLAENCLMESNALQPGRVRLAVVSKDGVNGDGVLATMHFTVRGPAGASSPLDLQNARAWAIRQQHANMPGMNHLVDAMATVEPGKVTVRGGMTLWLVVGGVLVVLIVILVVRRASRRSPAR